jgi:hypothetical protein
MNDPYPKLVIAQFHERYYPNARIVPNIVPINDRDYLPSNSPIQKIINIIFCPSVLDSAYAFRWDTKGFPETANIIKKVCKKYKNINYQFFHDLPHNKLLAKKKEAHISIDEVVTGSYHLSSLESLSMGIPTFAYLDTQLIHTLFELTGTLKLPWLNFNIINFEFALEEIIKDNSLRTELGKYSREWMENYWNDKNMVKHYQNAYNDLYSNPEIFKKNRFDPKNKIIYYQKQLAADILWKSQKEIFLKRTSKRNSLLCRFLKIFSKIKK